MFPVYICCCCSLKTPLKGFYEYLPSSSLSDVILTVNEKKKKKPERQQVAHFSSPVPSYRDQSMKPQ